MHATIRRWERTPAWFAEAACRGRTSLFVPSVEDERKVSLEVERQRQAVAICQNCPVLDQCRQWAIESSVSPVSVGVLGGLTAQQRQRVRREHRLGHHPFAELSLD